MSRASLFIFLAFWSCIASTNANKVNGTLVVPIHSEPAPILTPDYGIVTDKDRNKNRRSRIPFLPTPEDGYFYWQCLKTDKVEPSCIGVEREDAGGDCKRYSCVPSVDVLADGAHYAFVGHKGWCMEHYQAFKINLHRILRGQKTVCFGGEYLGENPPDRPSVKRSSAWFLMRIKTRRGRWDYFPD